MSSVDSSTSDIEFISNWTTHWLSTRKRVKFVFFTDDVEKWTKLLPQVDVMPHTRRMCNTRPTLNGMFETASKSYRSHFYMFLNRDTFVSTDILGATRVINNGGSTTRKEPVLMIARSMLVPDKQAAWQALFPESMSANSNVKYSRDGSSDIYMTNSQFEWTNIPSMIAHQTATSLLLTAFSRQQRVVLVDVTNSVNVIKILRKRESQSSSRQINRCVKNMLIESGIQLDTANICGNIMCVGLQTSREKGKDIVTSREIADDCSDCVMTRKDGPSWLPN
ncbi:hypothetical protein SNE40_005680 [Patella caerulea]